MSDNTLQMKLINQALAAAAASIELSKQLLAELTGVPKLTAPVVKVNSTVKPAGSFLSTTTIAGTVGVFDGENMVSDGGVKFPVPVNYASKTLLVFGDKLKMIDGNSAPDGSLKPGENSGKLFKQIERVKRQRVTGVLSQKDGSWFLTAPEGSYKVLEASVNHFGIKVGDKVVGILPKDNKAVPFAALEGPESQNLEQKEVKTEELTPFRKAEEVKVEVKPVEVKLAKEATTQIKDIPLAKTELPSKKTSPKVVKSPEAVVEAPVPKPRPTRTEKNEEKPTQAIKSEKIEKKSEPIISDDDLR